MFLYSIGIEINPLYLILLGITLGICTGFFGIGGGFMVTPGFNMLGMPMPFAIGTDMMQMAGKAVVSTLKHGRLGNVDLRLGIIMVIGTMCGVEAGKRIVMYLESIGNVDTTVRYIYIVFLVGLGLYMLRETSKSKESSPEVTGAKDTVKSSLVQKIQALNIPPFISLPTSGIKRISIWMPISIGFATGLLAGLLGVGGGFIRVPALIYLLGVPTVVAVGTDLFEIIISGGYGALTYAMVDRIDMMAGFVTMIAASAGVQIGVLATKYVRGDSLRKYFAYTILLAGVSVMLKQAGFLFGIDYLANAATYLLFGSAGGIGLLITVLFLNGYIRNKRELKSAEFNISDPSRILQ